MSLPKTDLTLEAAETLPGGVSGLTQIPGLQKTESLREGYAVTAITVLDERGEEALERPRGRYITVDLRPYFQRRSHYFPRGVRCLRREIMDLLPPMGEKDCVLVAGLGNRSLLCDAVGPLALDSLLVTRHMSDALAPSLQHFAPVAALAPGVLGQTGLETLEVLQGAAEYVHPAAIIVVDALTARSRHRLCATVQLSDTGLVPGSGVGNHRQALDAHSLGVPVIAIGIPTVMAGAVLAQELTGATPRTSDDLFVTPRDIDTRVRELSRLVGYGITSALQPLLTVDDITGLLG